MGRRKRSKTIDQPNELEETNKKQKTTEFSDQQLQQQQQQKISEEASSSGIVKAHKRQSLFEAIEIEDKLAEEAAVAAAMSKKPGRKRSRRNKRSKKQTVVGDNDTSMNKEDGVIQKEVVHTDKENESINKLSDVEVIENEQEGEGETISAKGNEITQTFVESNEKEKTLIPENKLAGTQHVETFQPEANENIKDASKEPEQTDEFKITRTVAIESNSSHEPATPIKQKQTSQQASSPVVVTQPDQVNMMEVSTQKDVEESNDQLDSWEKQIDPTLKVIAQQVEDNSSDISELAQDIEKEGDMQNRSNSATIANIANSESDQIEKDGEVEEVGKDQNYENNDQLGENEKSRSNSEEKEIEDAGIEDLVETQRVDDLDKPEDDEEKLPKPTLKAIYRLFQKRELKKLVSLLEDVQSQYTDDLKKFKKAVTSRECKADKLISSLIQRNKDLQKSVISLKKANSDLKKEKAQLTKNLQTEVTRSTTITASAKELQSEMESEILALKSQLTRKNYQSEILEISNTTLNFIELLTGVHCENLERDDDKGLLKFTIQQTGKFGTCYYKLIIRKNDQRDPALQTVTYEPIHEKPDDFSSDWEENMSVLKEVLPTYLFSEFDFPMNTLLLFHNKISESLN